MDYPVSNPMLRTDDDQLFPQGVLWDGPYSPFHEMPALQNDSSMLIPQHDPPTPLNALFPHSDHLPDMSDGSLRNRAARVPAGCDQVMQNMRRAGTASLGFWFDMKYLCENVIARTLNANPTGSAEAHPPLESGPLHLLLSSERCEWGECNTNFDSLTFAAIKRHLLEHHFGNIDNWEDGEHGYCEWTGCTYKKSMKCSSFPKHIATKHLGTLSKACERCGTVLSRGDSEKRHRTSGACRPKAI